MLSYVFSYIYILRATTHMADSHCAHALLVCGHTRCARSSTWVLDRTCTLRCALRFRLLPRHVFNCDALPTMLLEILLAFHVYIHKIPRPMLHLSGDLSLLWPSAQWTLLM